MNDRLQIAAMLLQGLYASPKNIGDHHHDLSLALQVADALLAECGEPKETLTAEDLELARLRGYEQGVEQMRKDAQPRKVEVTDEMVRQLFEYLSSENCLSDSVSMNISKVTSIINGGDDNPERTKYRGEQQLEMDL